MHRFRGQLTVLLVLVVGRVPLPWGHTHAGVAAQELSRHVSLFHGCTSAEPSLGWHWHSFWSIATAEDPSLACLESPSIYRPAEQFAQFAPSIAESNSPVLPLAVWRERGAEILHLSGCYPLWLQYRVLLL